MSDIGLFEYLWSKYGHNLVEKGLVKITVYDPVIPYAYRNPKLLCEGINTTRWWLYTKPGNSLTFDFLFPRYFNKIQVYNGGKYPWNDVNISYVLEFSKDNINYIVLYKETKSKRKERDVFYNFDEMIKYRYVRLREIDYGENELNGVSEEHGQYISWFEFYPAIFKEHTNEIIRQLCSIHIFIECFVNSSII